ncbi:MAG: acyl-CoA ligase (AMP-forming), exosortase A system-associated [Gammaproteobacteria bacterium]
MADLLPELIFRSADRSPDLEALIFEQQALSYGDLSALVQRTASGLIDLGLEHQERVAVYLEKRPETVMAMFGSAAAGGVFVPINPLLKAEQVAYILQDCNVRILVTSSERLRSLQTAIPRCHELRTIVLVDREKVALPAPQIALARWEEILATSSARSPHRCIDNDMVAILYTSGSTGKPKGVVLSHRNMVTGAKSVAQYLQNNSSDKILAVLPFSFDYGLSQLTTAFCKAACAVLCNYLLPRDVLLAAERHRISGLAAVPPLWIQLANLEWPAGVVEELRYITNSGGAMPTAVVETLQRTLPKTDIFLMYGLTEAFRSTYLPPAQLKRRPDSMGKAIPNAEVFVVREDGSLCAPNEPGELVHRGALVAMGYWNDPEKTAERFRPAPNRPPGLTLPEIAVWSGDTVRMDEEGFLYFVARRDEMIKTSGYRVSPTEIEEVLYATGLVGEAVAVGVPHPVLGQAIVVIVAPAIAGRSLDDRQLMEECKYRLPGFMLPAHIAVKDVLPRNPNGKIDRKILAIELAQLFAASS